MPSPNKFRVFAWWIVAAVSLLVALYAIFGMTIVIIARDLDVKDRSEGIGLFFILLAAGAFGFYVCRKRATITPNLGATHND